MQIGIIGLPNVGKSTLFTALTKRKVPAENYPFCTIEPNVGIVPVPDARLKQLASISCSKQTIPAVVEFVDIAGLVKNAHKGEGLGNQFLNYIRGIDAIVHVVRGFESTDIHHVEGSVNPERDIETITLELAMCDLEFVERQLASLSKKAKAGEKNAMEQMEILKKIQPFLNDGKITYRAHLTNEERDAVKEFNLLTAKPMLYVFNVTDIHDDAFKAHAPALFLNIQTEAELAEVREEELQEYLEQFGLQDTGLNKLIKKAYELLGYITFFTSGEKETRAWTVVQGAKAPDAAGKIHSDIQSGFIRAEVMNWKEFVEVFGWSGAKEKGLVRVEGKEYVIKDGDVCYFRFAH